MGYGRYQYNSSDEVSKISCFGLAPWWAVVDPLDKARRVDGILHQISETGYHLGEPLVCTSTGKSRYVVVDIVERSDAARVHCVR